jgi:hypothetical protein
VPDDDGEDSLDEYGAGSSSSWFDRWLKSQQTIKNILEECPLIVETDVSNFFPSVQLEILRSRLAVGSRLDNDATDLLAYLIAEVGPPRKRQRSVMPGLPVEDHDCSRTLAHFLLSEVDTEFRQEGEAGHYARFMDDIAIGAQSVADAMNKLARFQSALDRLGLYPNTSKTKWFTQAEWEYEYLREENDELGEIELMYREGDEDGARAALDVFVPALLGDEDGRRGWDRVLRRTCTVSKKCRSRALLAELPRLLWARPTAARHLLEYRASHPLAQDEAVALIEQLSESSRIYDDIDALLFEYLAIAPIVPAAVPEVRAAAGATIKSAFAKVPAVAASATTCFMKHSTDAEVAELSEWFVQVISHSADSIALQTLCAAVYARLALPIVAEEGLRRSQAVGQSTLFLDAISRGETGAVSSALSAVALREKKEPDRFMARARPLLFLRGLAKGGGEPFRRVSEAERVRHGRQREEFPDPSLESRWEWGYTAG